MKPLYAASFSCIQNCGTSGAAHFNGEGSLEELGTYSVGSPDAQVGSE